MPSEFMNKDPKKRLSLRIHPLFPAGILLSTLLVASASGVLFSFRSDPVRTLLSQIFQIRTPPLTNMTAVVTLSVADFGAVPNDGIDDRVAVAAAVAAAKTMTGPVQIDFSPGSYDFMPSATDFSMTPGNAAVLLQNCTNLVIDGHAAELLIHRQDVSAFWVVASTNLILRNFSVDYDPLPFSQGTVQSINAADGSFTFALQTGFPAPDDPFFSTCDSWGMLKDPMHPGRLKTNCPSFFYYKEISPVGDNRFSIVLSNATQIASFAAGDVFVVNGRSASIGRYQQSKEITFENFTVYASPSALFIGVQTSLLNVLNCRAVLKGDRLITSGADAVHCQASRIGPWVENCDFEGLSDDCLTVYGLPIYILSQDSPTQMTVKAQAPVLPGDRLAFFDPNDGRIIKDTTVAAFSNNTLTLNDPVNEVLNLAPTGTEYDSRSWKIYDHAYNENAVGNHFVYRNNHIHDGRRYGVFIKASYGLVESNRFAGLSSQAMEIANDPAWPEGFWAQNLIIRNNWVSECGYGNGSPCARIASLQLNSTGTGAASMIVPIQKNIFLLNNVFSAFSGRALIVSGVDGLIAEGNEFSSGSASGPLVTVQYSTNIVWNNNLDQGRVVVQ